jgi:hypothetical protein
MKQISDRIGGPEVFDLVSSGAELGLRGYSAGPDDRWNAVNEFVFRFRK